MAAIDGMTDAEVAEVRRRVAVAQQERIAALVALCEEVLEYLATNGFARDADEYRARLALLQGEG